MQVQEGLQMERNELQVFENETFAYRRHHGDCPLTIPQAHHLKEKY